MVSSNDYINSYKSIKYVVRCKATANRPPVHPGRFTRTLKMNLTEPVTFGFL
jgi:hypothetical protein